MCIRDSDKSPATVEDEDRLVASAPTFLAFIGAPIFLLGIVFLTKCIPKREYYVAGVVTIFKMCIRDRD